MTTLAYYVATLENGVLHVNGWFIFIVALVLVVCASELAPRRKS